jgi:hypothetical protein
MGIAENNSPVKEPVKDKTQMNVGEPRSRSWSSATFNEANFYASFFKYDFKRLVTSVS